MHGYVYYCITYKKHFLHTLSHLILSTTITSNPPLPPGYRELGNVLRTLHATSVEKEESGKKSNEKVYFDICKGP